MADPLLEQTADIHDETWEDGSNLRSIAISLKRIADVLCASEFVGIINVLDSIDGSLSHIRYALNKKANE